ncbi:hypothetical protein CQ054_00660 [Ochrobactrum sp. MYb29]|nr:hypothetical protein CWE02_12230 [Brucella pituitosa]PRA88689.1 hypothetical protein CQ054_00660 [Ochrobactrum sp. MYb29]
MFFAVAENERGLAACNIHWLLRYARSARIRPKDPASITTGFGLSSLPVILPPETFPRFDAWSEVVSNRVYDWLQRRSKFHAPH